MPTPPDGTAAAIVTLTMNPALDVTATTDKVRPTSKVRCHSARHDPGGGGINVARVAHALGAAALAVFPAGGQTGDLLIDLLADERVPLRRIGIAGRTRESFTVNEESSGQQYRFVLAGPRLSAAERGRCVDQLRAAARSAQIVVASGSLPPGVPAAFYQSVADLCAELGVRLILDASGLGLRNIASGVFLVKPSVRELGDYVGAELDTEQAIVAAGRRLISDTGVRVAVVSRGAQGALLVTSQRCQRFRALPMRPVSSVGAGDAMVAGIAVGLSRGWPLAEAVRLGIAASAAMLMTRGTAVCSRDDVERFFQLAGQPEPVDPVCS